MIEKIIEKVRLVLDLDVSSGIISQKTGVSRSTIFRLRSGQTEIEDISLRQAEKLISYEQSIKVKKKMVLRVISDWHSLKQDVEIVRIERLDGNKKIVNDLFWFSGSSKPNLKRGQILNFDQFVKYRCYKQATFVGIEQISKDIILETLGED